MAFCPLNQINKKVTRLKAKTPKLLFMKSTVQIFASSYIGITKQYLKSCLSQHKYNCKDEN